MVNHLRGKGPDGFLIVQNAEWQLREGNRGFGRSGLGQAVGLIGRTLRLLCRREGHRQTGGHQETHDAKLHRPERSTLQPEVSKFTVEDYASLRRLPSPSGRLAPSLVPKFGCGIDGFGPIGLLA